ncbi:MAG: type I methionyl aminopeptidase [Opitutae bacterium]|jgi:methionyl aminopeptidase|nr:type I methionyl aminopeptidase [Opitutae bacterium]NBY41911.1 type I methionyl aminopeptidase [Verrucomicrobiota bacterium]
MIDLKSDDEVKRMRAACSAAARVLQDLVSLVVPGISTAGLDSAARGLMLRHGCESACYGYVVGGLTYPGYVCISLNDEVVHGIGSSSRIIRDGDLVSLDVVVRRDGFIGDNARTITVGKVSPEAKALCVETEKALHAGIAAVRPGNRVGDISAAIQASLSPGGYGIVRDFVGHGVGRKMHEEPQIPNFGKAGTGPKLLAGMCLAIEPMVNLGSPKIIMGADGWTARTSDGKVSAHFEHTVMVTEKGAEILTLP